MNVATGVTNPLLSSGGILNLVRWLFIWGIASTSLCSSLPESPPPPPDPSIAILRDRMLPASLSMGLQGSSIEVQTCLNRLQEDGSFSDLEPISETLTYRILKMAQAYRSDPAFQGSEPLKAGIYAALRYWLDHRVANSNWTYRSFHEPNAGAAVGILMWDAMQADMQTSSADNAFLTQLSADLIQMCNQTWTDMSHLYDPHLGANLAFRLFGMLGRAVLINNPDSVQRVHEHLLSSFEVGLGKNGQGNTVFFHVGQTPDYSWHQHNFDGAQHYWLGYGMRWIEEAIYYSEFTTGTSWALGSAQFQQLENCYLEGIQYLFYRGQGLYSAAGRDGLRKTQWSLETYVYKRLIDDLKAAGGSNLRRLPELNQARAYLNNVSDPSFSINRYYQNSDLLIRGRPNHYVALKMISNRTVGPESGNGNGKKVFHFGGGSTMIHQQGGEYAKARVGWNYRALPGITAEQKTGALPLVDWGWDNGGLNAFAGGLDNDTLSCAGFQLHRDNAYATVRGNKGYFFFDREMVCLGSNIRQAGATGKEIWTTLNQPEWRAPVTYRIEGSKQQLSMNSENQLNFSLNQTGWVHQDGIGYVVLPGSSPTNLKLWAETRSGNWRDLDSRNANQTEQVEIFQLSINHGTNPSADAYQYIVVPEIEANELDGYLAQLPIRILRNSPAVQAVKHLPSRTTQAIFYAATEQVQTDNGLLIGTDRPVILMVQEEANGLRIRWSDPLQSQSQVVISLNQAFQSAPNIQWNTGTEASSILLNFPGGLDVGTSQEAFFAYEEHGGGTFPLVWGEIQAEAKPELGAVELLWSTESEENNAQFQIERSRDGLIFSPQDQVLSQGNSTTVQSYTWQDSQPVEGKSYYRLRQIDLDGQYSYSPLAEVWYEPSATIRIEAYPVPLRQGERLQVVVYAAESSVPYVRLVDMMGREVRRYPIPGKGDKSELSLETEGLTTGIYYLTAGSSEEFVSKQILMGE